MVEVTREMILEYMQSKGGVVKNVDLVRNFRKYLQLSDQRAKDQARERFKARVNEVAYIKADSKGEKYLYLKAEYTTSSQSSVGRDSARSTRDSAHSTLSKRDSAHSLLSKRDSLFSLSETPGQDHTSGQRSTTSRTPPRNSPGHTAGSSTSGQPNRQSGQANRQSGQANRQSGQPIRQSGQQNWQSGQGSRESGRPNRQSGQPSGSTAAGGDSAALSLLGDSLLSDSTLGSFLAGGSSLGGAGATPTATPTAGSGGGDSSFASDIFGAIGGGFWGDSTSLSGGGTLTSGDSKATSKPTTESKTSKPPSTVTASSTSSSRSTPRHSASNRAGTSQVAGGRSSDVTLQSYKPLSSPPRVPLPPPTSQPPPPPSRTAPPPPKRNLSSPATSGSVFSPPPPPGASEGAGSLLSELTSDLGSFGELGSLLDSFGDFSLSRKTPTATATSLTQPAMDDTGEQSRTALRRSSSSDRSSSVTLVAEGKPPPAPSPHTQSPGKSSAVGGSVTGVRSTPPPAPGSPMRVPRTSPRSTGFLTEAPPSPLSRRHGSLESHQRQGSQDGSSPRIQIQRVDSPQSDFQSNGLSSPPHHQTGVEMRGRYASSALPPLPPSAMLGPTSDPRRVSAAATSNGGVGVVLRPQDRTARDRAVQSSLRRSRNLDRTANLESLTRASIMMTPPSVRRSLQQAPGAGGSGMYARPAPSSSGEDLSQYQEDGSLSAPSDDYEPDPLEKEWMLACASSDLEALLELIIKDDTLINRKGFLHGTALHWAAKLGRCDIMSALILNGAFPNIKSGGFTALHLACQGGYHNAIAMLVRDQGANVNVRDNSGRKPVDMLNYSCHESIRVLLIDRQTGRRAGLLHHSSEYLPSFSQPRNRLGSLTNTWASMPNSLEASDDKKKRASPKMNKRTFSFRNKHKINSPGHDKKERPRSHIPETYDA